MKTLTTLAAFAIAFSAFAQGTPTQNSSSTKASTIKIKAKGEDVRTIIDSIFEQSGKQYVLETNVHQGIYMSLDNTTFEKAIEIISRVADLQIEEKQGVYYVRSAIGASKAKPTTMTPMVKTAAKAPITKKPIMKVAAKPMAKKPTTTTKPIAAQSFANMEDQAAGAAYNASLSKPATSGSIDLTPKLTVQLKKMNIRDVFSEMTQQTKVEIEVDETVPNYKLDAYFYNTSLKFALDKICKIAGLKYTFTPSKTVRISKA